MPDPTARLGMFLYYYSFHGLPGVTEGESLAEVIGLAISDLESGDAWPEKITENGADLWCSPGFWGATESLSKFARTHGVNYA